MQMTWTSAFGRACGWLLDKIVHGLALTRISPNVLTFIGLVINIVAAFLFGHANAANADWMFLYAGMVIFGAGIFDMVDGRVARRNNQVTVFGSFFDSVIDRYSDVVLFFGLLVYYGRINRFRYVVLVAFVMVTSLMVSYTRARAEALIGQCKGFHGAAGAHRAHHYRRPLQPLGRNGPCAVGSGRALHHHRGAPHHLHLPEHQATGAAELRDDSNGCLRPLKSVIF
jgi:CDP-diacylglycerol--glycerol-3-phosphate 3-phosphatidyltransferase